MSSDIAIGNTAGMGKTASLKANTPEKKALKDACKEFEGLLIGIILKDGIKTESLEEDAATGGDIFQEYASEQVARDMGQNESFGIARMMYEQLSGEKRDAK